MLTDFLSLVDDSRSHINREHDLVDVMFLVINGVLSGAEGWADIESFGHEKIDWLRTFRSYTNGIPTRHSIARIIRTVNAERLALALYSWVNSLRKVSDNPVIALDGKTIRGAVNRNESNKTLHMVSAFDTDNGITLFQKSTKGKGTEIAAVRELLAFLDIKRNIITLDALHAQPETLNQIHNQGGDYIIQLKQNQGILYHQVQNAFAGIFKGDTPEELASMEVSEKGHGREETRTLYQLPVNESMKLDNKWHTAKSIIAVDRSRKVKGKTSYETSFYISSLDCNAQLAFRAIRHHWRIENQQHWILDAVWREDDCQIGDREAAEVFALFRRIALNMTKQHPGKMSNRQKLKRAGWSDAFRAELFFC